MADHSKKDKPIKLHLNHIERSRWRRGIAAATNIHPSAFRLATVLEDLMNNQTGEAFAGQDELAALSAVSVRQVRDHLKSLEAAGWIVVLSGKERTGPRSKRGLHYRPAWPDEATKTRCVARNYAAYVDVKSGGEPPVINEIETGDLASLNRRSSVSKPAVGRRSHSNDRVTTHTGGAAQAASALDIIPHQLKDEENSSSRQAFAYASLSDTGEEEATSSEADDLDGPRKGDFIEIGQGAEIEVEEAEASARKPRDPDGLTADRREEETPDLASIVPRYVASLVDLSSVVEEPTEQIALPIAAQIARASGFDLHDVARFVEEVLWDAVRANDTSPMIETNLDTAIPY